VILLLSGAGLHEGSESAEVVVWMLDRLDAEHPPCFSFTNLTVFGAWTPFAETVADYLSTQCGTHFVFENPGAKTRSP
jgi:hypothetical protein